MGNFFPRPRAPTPLVTPLSIHTRNPLTTQPSPNHPPNHSHNHTPIHTPIHPTISQPSTQPFRQPYTHPHPNPPNHPPNHSHNHTPIHTPIHPTIYPTIHAYTVPSFCWTNMSKADGRPKLLTSGIHPGAAVIE